MAMTGGDRDTELKVDEGAQEETTGEMEKTKRNGETSHAMNPPINLESERCLKNATRLGGAAKVLHDSANLWPLPLTALYAFAGGLRCCSRMF